MFSLRFSYIFPTGEGMEACIALRKTAASATMSFYDQGEPRTGFAIIDVKCTTGTKRALPEQSVS